jgi:diguanylate cyclase (GGDEF)-like protein
VVSSAVQHIPVVAFAVPFSTPSGLRVMSGTLQISSGPLGDFLQSTRSIAGSSIYLADMSNRIIASAPAGPIATSLSTTLANLKANSAQTVSGHYEVGYTIAGTPWKIIASLPTAQLFGPIDGVARLVPWLLLGGFALIATILGLVLLVIWERKLTEAAKAGIDPLTGLANRRQLEERTSVLFSASSRHDFDLAVLMIDIDHFKGVNDRFGHQVGDKVLRAVAHCLQACLRTEDVGARWGGEEFVAVLPYTDLAGATHVAERLRALIAATAVEAGSHGTIHVTVSIGVSADAAGTTAAQMIGFADGALYRAKHNGRNCVVQADPSRSASAVGSFDY